MEQVLSTARPPTINTYGFLWSHRADHAVQLLIEHGYREFEVMLQPPHLELDPLCAAASGLASMVKDGTIRLHALNMPSLDQNLASPFPEMRAYTRELFIRQIRLAGAIGVEKVVMAPGRISPLFPAPRELLEQWLLEAVEALLPVAAEEGVALAIENLPIAALPRAADILDFLRRVGPNPHLRVCYDVANAHFIGEDPLAGIQLLRNHLAIIHFSDTGKQVWRHDVIGTGEIAFSPICDLLAELGWNGPLVLEIIAKDQNATDAIRHSHRALCGSRHKFGL